MSLKIIKHMKLYSDERFYSSFPCSCQLDNGEVLVAFRRGRDSRYLLKNADLSLAQRKRLLNQVDHVDGRSHIAFLRLNDQLNPSDEVEMFDPDPEVADQDASLLKTSQGKLILASFSWYPITPDISKKVKPLASYIHGSARTTGTSYILWGGFTARGDSTAKNWQQRRYIAGTDDMPDILTGVRGPNGGPPRGSLAEDKNGNIYMATYGGLIGAKASQCFLWKSTDQGASWQFQNIIASDSKIGFREPSLLIDSNNKLICFMRTADAKDKIATAISLNFGKTWQTHELHEAQGHPSHPLLLADGRILLVFGYRHKKYGIRARVLDNRACAINQAFLQSAEFIIRDDAPTADIGYPWGLQLNGGGVLITYYFTGSDGIRHIAATLLKVEDT